MRLMIFRTWLPLVGIWR